jgi:hypothetical protein
MKCLILLLTLFSTSILAQSFWGVDNSDPDKIEKNTKKYLNEIYTGPGKVNLYWRKENVKMVGSVRYDKATKTCKATDVHQRNITNYDSFMYKTLGQFADRPDAKNDLGTVDIICTTEWKSEKNNCYNTYNSYAVERLDTNCKDVLNITKSEYFNLNVSHSESQNDDESIGKGGQVPSKTVGDRERSITGE